MQVYICIIRVLLLINGTISSGNYGVKFLRSYEVLELGKNSVTDGIVSGISSENLIILNIGQKGTENFQKLAASGNTILTGVVNLA